MMRALILFLFLLSLGCSQPTQQTGGYQSIEINESITNDTSIDNIIAPYRELIQDEMNRVLVHSDTTIYKGIPESPLGDLIANLSLDCAKQESKNLRLETPEMCLLNFGGLRVELPQGEILVSKVYELMPFENELVLLRITGDSVQSMINYMAHVGGQPVSGFRGELSGEKILNPQIDGYPFNPHKEYTVVTTDYLANGGDRMVFFLEPIERVGLGVKLRDAIIHYFEQVGKRGEALHIEMDGRLTIKE